MDFDDENKLAKENGIQKTWGMQKQGEQYFPKQHETGGCGQRKGQNVGYITKQVREKWERDGDGEG